MIRTWIVTWLVGRYADRGSSLPRGLVWWLRRDPRARRIADKLAASELLLALDEPSASDWLGASFSQPARKNQRTARPLTRPALAGLKAVCGVALAASLALAFVPRALFAPRSMQPPKQVEFTSAQQAQRAELAALGADTLRVWRSFQASAEQTVQGGSAIMERIAAEAEHDKQELRQKLERLTRSLSAL